MRRILSVFLLLFFGLPLIAPALGLTGGPQNQLPICCRKNGAHRCAQSMVMGSAADQAEPGQTPVASTRYTHCPAYPEVTTSAHHLNFAAPTSAAIFAELFSHPAIHAQTEARARVALDLSRQKRGPPTSSL